MQKKVRPGIGLAATGLADMIEMGVGMQQFEYFEVFSQDNFTQRIKVISWIDDNGLSVPRRVNQGTIAGVGTHRKGFDDPIPLFCQFHFLPRFFSVSITDTTMTAHG